MKQPCIFYLLQEYESLFEENVNFQDLPSIHVKLLTSTFPGDVGYPKFNQERYEE